MSGCAGLEAGRCPLCGRANGCRMAGGGAWKGPCWCEVVEMPDALLARIPEEARGRACVCHACVAEFRAGQGWQPLAVPGEYYLDAQGRMVFTARYHLRRGYCCDQGCRHCPYDAEGRPGPDAVAGAPERGAA
ncbi:MAG: cysteine-rich CWC family protein [Verrucomicrobiota bacterium]